MQDAAASDSGPAKSPGIGGMLVLIGILLLPAAVSYESFDKFFNDDGPDQCNAVFCYSRDTQVTHREVRTRGSQDVSSESVYYCARHASLAELELLPRLWRLLVWLFVALCNAITLFAACAFAMMITNVIKGKRGNPAP